MERESVLWRDISNTKERAPIFGGEEKVSTTGPVVKLRSQPLTIFPFNIHIHHCARYNLRVFLIFVFVCVLLAVERNYKCNIFLIPILLKGD